MLLIIEDTHIEQHTSKENDVCVKTIIIMSKMADSSTRTIDVVVQDVISNEPVLFALNYFRTMSLFIYSHWIVFGQDFLSNAYCFQTAVFELRDVCRSSKFTRC